MSIAAAVSRIACRPVRCDLISAQAAVLERNVSAEVAAEYKRAAIANVMELGRLIGERVPELDAHRAGRVAAGTLLVTGAIWTHAQPSAAMLAAYEADPQLASLRLDFTATLREMLQVLLAGVLARG
ncbi:hypothetical protein [Streptomyces sp. MBT58]|uniref:hypothetical protein n=1 Tax=Streptomyces sp. MBT58 TaxID=1488389 RepID=UPI0027DDEA25|nr:hypothetical protein [Streptomyces sp. MBT58]